MIDNLTSLACRNWQDWHQVCTEKASQTRVFKSNTNSNVYYNGRLNSLKAMKNEEKASHQRDWSCHLVTSLLILRLNTIATLAAQASAEELLWSGSGGAWAARNARGAQKSPAPLASNMSRSKASPDRCSCFPPRCTAIQQPKNAPKNQSKNHMFFIDVW